MQDRPPEEVRKPFDPAHIRPDPEEQELSSEDRRLQAQLDMELRRGHIHT